MSTTDNRVNYTYLPTYLCMFGDEGERVVILYISRSDRRVTYTYLYWGAISTPTPWASLWERKTVGWTVDLTGALQVVVWEIELVVVMVVWMGGSLAVG